MNQSEGIRTEECCSPLAPLPQVPGSASQGTPFILTRFIKDFPSFSFWSLKPQAPTDVPSEGRGQAEKEELSSGQQGCGQQPQGAAQTDTGHQREVGYASSKAPVNHRKQTFACKWPQIASCSAITS